MNRTTETDSRQEPTPDEGRSHALATFGVPHLLACLGTAIAVVIAINVFD